MINIDMLKNRLVEKEMTFGTIEDIINDETNRLEYDTTNIDTFFSDNMFYAFENMCHSYEINEDVWVNIVFETNIEKDFNIYEDTVIVKNVELL